MNFKISVRTIAITLAAGIFAIGSAQAQTSFPNETVRIIVPYGPGGATDLVARFIAEGLSEEWSQSVIVENLPGASGELAIQELVSADPDGYTLFIGNVTTNMLNPLLQGDEMAADPLAELVPVTRLVTLPHIMVATTVDFPPNSLSEVVEHAKERPGELNHSSAGFMSYTHVDFLRLQDRAGIEIEMIPLQAGAGGGQTDLLTGDVQLAITNAATVLPFVESGDLKPVAVTSSERLAALPDTETFAEAGFEGIGTSAWQAMFVSGEVPEERIEQIHAATIAALENNSVRTQLEERLFEIVPHSTTEEAKDWIENEIETWQPALERAQAVLESR